MSSSRQGLVDILLFARSGKILKIGKEGLWVVLGQLAVALGSLTLVRVLTEMLTPAAYGEFMLILTFVALSSQAIFGGMTQGIQRYYPIAEESSEIRGYLAACRKALTVGSIVSICSGLLIACTLYLMGYPTWIGMVIPATALAILYGYNSVLSNIQNAARQRIVVATHLALDAWLKIMLTAGLLLLFGSSIVNVCMGYILAALIVALSQRIYLRKIIHLGTLAEPKIERNTWINKIWVYSWPFSIWGIFSWMQQSSDRWALAYFGSPEDIGLYAVLYQIGYIPIGLAIGMLMSFLAPILYQQSGNATDTSKNNRVDRIIWWSTYTVLAITLLSALITIGIHEWLFSLIVADAFRPLSYLLPWVVLAGGLFAAGQTLALKLMSELKTSELLIPKIATSLMGVIFNAIGAAWAGPDGVIGALVGFSVLYLLWMAFLAKERTPNRNL
jgi:O-antigen/teichoic acid export membrane protein